MAPAGVVHLAGLAFVIGSMVGAKTEAEKPADGLAIHAGMDETSLVQFLEAASRQADAKRAARQEAWLRVHRR